MSGSQQLLLGTGVSAVAANYIEDVFSTWLYTGNSSTQTITNGIDLSTKGGLVWVKSRSVSGNNWTQDTARGVNSVLYPNLTNAAGNPGGTAVSSFDTTGFTLGTNTNINNTGDTYASWTFRKQAKFFDVVTFTASGSNTNLRVSHSLGSVPGCWFIKRTDSSGAWFGYHRSLGVDAYMVLNMTAAQSTGSNWWGTAPTSTDFGINEVNLGASGTYVAYLFAHDAGGFGLTGTDNVISCGSFTTDGSGNATVNLGYEPQWLITKTSTTTSDWIMVDVMRGFNNTDDQFLLANTSSNEYANGFPRWVPTATGFTHNQANANQTYIYIAIRRGPMKTPTTGTSVFSPVAQTSTANQLVSTGFPVDLLLERGRTSSSDTWDFDRLRGSTSTSAPILSTSSTAAESTSSPYGFGFANNTGVTDNWGYGSSTIYWNFRRAPGFFDVVCYTGTGATQTITHNLTVAPELLILKSRTNATDWRVLVPAAASSMREGYLNVNNGFNAASVTIFGDGSSYVAPTATNFTVGSYWGAGNNVVSYLFATVAGVSKVGIYTGTGALQTINCGFTGGARFVLIKRINSPGNWFVYDSARGISSGNDPYLLLDSTAAEVTNTNYVDTTNVGFQVTAAAPSGLNASGSTYIFLAIA